MKLEIASAIDQLVPLLLPALPECLQQLQLSTAYTPETFELAMAALESRPLPALKELLVYLPPSDDSGAEGGRERAQRLLTALASHPRGGLTVGYWSEALNNADRACDTVSTHLPFLKATLPCIIGHSVGPGSDPDALCDAASSLSSSFMQIDDTEQFEKLASAAINAGAVPALLSALHSAAASCGGTLHCDVNSAAWLLRALLLAAAHADTYDDVLPHELRAPLMRTLFRLLSTERPGVTILSRYSNVCQLQLSVLSIEESSEIAGPWPALALDCLAAYHRLPRLSGAYQTDAPHFTCWLSVLVCWQCCSNYADRDALRQALAEHHITAPNALRHLGLDLSFMLLRAASEPPAWHPLAIAKEGNPSLNIDDATQYFAHSYALCPAVLRLTSVRVALHSLLDDCRSGGSLLRSEVTYSAVCTRLNRFEQLSEGALSFGAAMEAARAQGGALRELGADPKSPALMCAEHPHFMGRVHHQAKWPHMLRVETLPGGRRVCALCAATVAGGMLDFDEYSGIHGLWRCAQGCLYELCDACMEARFLQRSHRREGTAY